MNISQLAQQMEERMYGWKSGGIDLANPSWRWANKQSMRQTEQIIVLYMDMQERELCL
jgi:hypothetical protein